jgi:hypothetical protein
MARESKYRDLHAAADRLEPRLALAFLRAVAAARRSVSINRLAMLLATRDVATAKRILSRAELERAMEPVGTVARDAVLRGGPLGADLLNVARRS